MIPGDDVDADSALAPVAVKTLREHLDHTCRKPLAGKIGSGCDLTWGWMLAAAVRLRDKECANTLLKDVGLADFVKSNGMFAYIGGRIFKNIEEKRQGYTVANTQPHSLLGQSGCKKARESSMIMVQSGGGFIFSLLETMLQSHKKQIKLFPCMLDIMGNAASFHDLKAEGGLLVSAGLKNNAVEWFKIDCTCEDYRGTLRFFGSDIPSELVTSDGKVLPALGDGVFELNLAAGESIRWGSSVDSMALPPHADGIKSYGGGIEFDYGKKGAYYQQQ